MLVSSIREENLTPDLIDKLLFCGLCDTGESCDCIIVLGSNKAERYRVPVAVDAYKAGRSDKILLCGGTQREVDGESLTESQIMRTTALALGVRECDIITENFSLNTVENILFAMAILQRKLWLNNLGSVLLVTTAYHMRRAVSIARHYFPDSIKIIPCPADDENTRRDNWENTEVGTKRVRDEAMNIVRCVKNGVFPDFEI